MLHFTSYIAASKVHGLGLFANQPIKKDEIVWTYSEFTTVQMNSTQFLLTCQGLSSAALLDTLDFTYKRRNSFYYLNDHSKFINHSNQPNIGFKDCFTEIALSNIRPGEEILENYIASYDQNDLFFDAPDFREMSKQQILDFLHKRFRSKKRLYSLENSLSL